ncbi:MAG: hypothetical protein IT373_38290 [Polyangiaceae bacterium]|nr:hypothetical protein [Polyangiaceae bacterium]
MHTTSPDPVAPTLRNRWRRPLMGLACVASLLAAACGGSGSDKATAESARRPPPPAPARPVVCGGEARVNDPGNVAGLPKSFEGYCLDPAGSDKGFGDGAKQGIDGICDVFDGECEIYKRHHVKRVVEVRYVDGGGSASSLDVYLSTFDAPEQAYAMFTKRVVGDGDPAHPDTPRPIAGGGAAALGTGNAYLWRGAMLAEVTFNDDKASAADIKARADKLLPSFVKALGDGLAGATELPVAAAELPKPDLLPLGVRHVTGDVLDVAGVGPGAFGYYRDGEQRWRMLSIVRADDAQGRDVLGTLGKLAGAAEEKALGDGAVRFGHAEAAGMPQAEWLVARKGKRVVGIGDETRVLTAGMSPDERAKRCLSLADKKKRLAALLAALE